MKLSLFLILLLPCLSTSGADKTNHPYAKDRVQSYRVLMVGDSWSYLMWLDETMRRLFEDKGHPSALEKGDVTAISGSKASEWAQPANLQLISDELTANPSIDMIQLSMGGNDFLAGQPNGWYRDMDPSLEADLFERILLDLETVVNYIVQFDPTLKIVIGGYDYPNFEDSRTGIGAFVCTPYWDDMAEPLPIDINTAMTGFENMMRDYASTVPQLTYVRHLGAMQYLYGYPPLGIEPGQLLPPGDLTLPSAMESMRLGVDCFHLNETGYDTHALDLWDHFYADIFCLHLSEVREGFPDWHAEFTVLDYCQSIGRLCSDDE